MEPSRQTAFVASPPLIGRDREIARLEALFAAARSSGHGRVGLISGGAGVGKTRLVEELALRLQDSDEAPLVLTGRCRAGAAPYQPALEMIHAALAQTIDRALVERGRMAMAALAGRAAPVARAAAWELRRAALFDECTRFFVALGRPLLLIVRDLHVADGATRGLVEHLAEAALPSSLLVVTSQRPEAALLLGPAVEHIALTALDLDGVRAFLQSPEVVARVAAATGGRPTTLAAWIERISVEEERAQTSTLGEGARALATALAVYGRPMAVEALGRAVGLADATLLRAVHELTDAQVTVRQVVDGELRLAFAGASDEEAAYQASDPQLRARLHLAAGRALADDQVAAAEHLLRASAGEEAVDAALSAGERLEIAFGYERAIDLYRRAHALTVRDHVRALLEERLYELERLTGNYAAALADAERLRARNPQDAVAHRRVAELHVLGDACARALQTLDEAERVAAARHDRDEILRLAALRAEAFLGAGQLSEAAAECARALTADVDIELTLQARNTLGKVRLAESGYAAAAALFSLNLDDARVAGRSFEECRALYNLGIVELRLNEHAQAEARYREALAVADTVGDLRNRAFCLQNLGTLAHWRHDYSAALNWLHQAVTAFQRLGQRSRLAWLALDLVSVYLDIGDDDRASMMLSVADQLSGTTLLAAVAVDREQMHGRVAAKRGDYDAAERHFNTALARALGGGDFDRAAEARLGLVRVALDRSELDLAVARLDELEHVTSRTTRPRVRLFAGEHSARRGDQVRARRALGEAIELAQSAGDLDTEWRALYWLGLAVGAGGEALRYLEAARTIDERLRCNVPGEQRAMHAAEPLRQKLQQLLAERDPSRPVAQPSSQRYPRIIGKHPRLLQLFAQLDKIAPWDSLVLIRGESGTGKELVADALHAASPRRDRPLVKVNCGALVESLLLSELFGHERGAFTGAHQRKKGRFEAADGGTLFLDEIGDISPKTQVALLRVLQEREFTRVGGNTLVKVDVRILCATHRDLEQMVARGQFREDLYYRLRGLQLELPALRERIEDLPLLAASLLERVAAERGGEPKQLDGEALALLSRHPWPGNVRELDNVLRSVSLFVDGPLIQASHLADYSESFRPPRPTFAGTAALPTGPAWTRLSSEGLSLKALKTVIEIECITEALKQSRGNITHAAALLGMKRPRLSQLVREHGISLPSGEDRQ
jgi:transcriptional regulator with GAF, ATPase, and Fis domain